MTRLWHIVWSLSLLGAATVAAVWIACGWCSYVYQRTSGGGSLQRALYVEQGHLYLIWAQPGAPSMLTMPNRTGWDVDARGRWWTTPATPAREPKWWLLGASFAPARSAGELNWFVAPLLWPLLALLVLPVVQLGRWGRAVWRHYRGRCTNCGYDLRESAGACPECGEDVSAESVTA